MGAKSITGTCLVLKQQRLFVRNPFNVKLDDVAESDQDEFLEMKFDSGMKFFLKNILYKNSGHKQIYPILELGSLGYIPSYLWLQLICVSRAFLPYYKQEQTKNSFRVEHDIRCSLSTTDPQIDTLAIKKQTQP